MMLVQGLFDHMNQERSQVISGIGRYARNQLELAARLRKEASEVDALRAKPDANTNEITDAYGPADLGNPHLRGARAVADLCLRGPDADRAAALRAGEDGG